MVQWQSDFGALGHRTGRRQEQRQTRGAGETAVVPETVDVGVSVGAAISTAASGNLGSTPASDMPYSTESSC